MARKLFRFTDPETHEMFVAKFITHDEFHAMARERYADGLFVHPFRFLLEVTQWGFDRQTTIVCAEDQRTELRYAFRVTTFYEDQPPQESVADWAGQRPV